MDVQHGFRKKNSCETQLITIIGDMTCNLSNGTQIDAVFLDFAKAFDKVPHQRLLLKLEYYGIRSNTLQWIGSFLNNRKQCVIVEGVSSNVVPVTSGVPQGSVLGQLLFLIFLNDLPESITSSVKLFADNCLAYRTIHSSNDAIRLQEDLVQLGLWVNSRQMTLNPHKCSVMHISNKHNTVCAKYTINDLPLNCVCGVKYLGVSISSKMSSSDHIDDICTKARK